MQVPKGITLDADTKKQDSGVPKGITVDEDPKKIPEIPKGDPMAEMIKSDFVRRMPKEEARRQLSARSRHFNSLSLDQQDKVLADLPGPQDNNKTPFADKLATGAERGVKGMLVDFPKSIYHAAKDQPTAEEVGRARRHPHLLADPKRGAGLTLDRLILDPQVDALKKSRKAAEKGEGTESLGYSVAAGLPVAGPIAAHFGEEIGKGEVVEAIGEAGVMFLSGKLFGAATKDVASFKRMAKASGGGAKDFEVIAPDLVRSANKYGRPSTVGQLQDLVIKTGRDLESDFNVQLQPIAANVRMPSEVSNALLAKANERHLLKTPEGRLTRQLLRQKAIDYQKPWTLGELNKQRMDMFNARLENKTQVGQMAAVKSSADVMANKIIEDKLRDIVYDDMEKHYKGSVNFRLLKQKQSRILDTMDRMEKQVQTLADAQAEMESAGPVEKLGLSVSGHFGGMTPRVHGLLKTLQGGPEKVANKQVGRAFPPSIKNMRTLKDAKAVPTEAARKALKQAVRNLPVAALYEKAKEKDAKPKEKKALTGTE